MIRGALVGIVVVLLLLGLAIGGFLYTISSSLQYDEIQADLVPSVADVIINQTNFVQVLEDKSFEISKNCEQYVDYVFKLPETNFVFSIPCNVSGESIKNIGSLGVEQQVKKLYFKEYDCSFFECLFEEENSLFFVSNEAKEYVDSKLYYVVVACIVLICLGFLFAENRKSFIVLLGICFILSSFGMKFIVSILMKTMSLSFWNLLGIETIFSFSVFSDTASFVFWVMIVVGIILVVVGLGLKLAHVGNKIGNLFKKKDKPETVEPPKEEKVEEQKPPKEEKVVEKQEEPKVVEKSKKPKAVDKSKNKNYMLD